MTWVIFQAYFVPTYFLRMLECRKERKIRKSFSICQHFKVILYIWNRMSPTSSLHTSGATYYVARYFVGYQIYITYVLLEQNVWQWSHYICTLYFKLKFSTFWRLSGTTHPFILHARFLHFLEIWFKKYGLRNLVREKWMTRKKDGFVP